MIQSEDSWGKWLGTFGVALPHWEGLGDAIASFPPVGLLLYNAVLFVVF